MVKSRKNKGKNKNVKTVCKSVCGKTRKILENLCVIKEQ